MNHIHAEIRRLISGYVRRGGKANRRQQARRMLAFGDFCAQQGAKSLAQIGARHVIGYWRSELMQQLSDRTREAHFYALVTLWRLAGKTGTPPRPYPAVKSTMG